AVQLVEGMRRYTEAEEERDETGREASRQPFGRQRGADHDVAEVPERVRPVDQRHVVAPPARPQRVVGRSHAPMLAQPMTLSADLRGVADVAVAYAGPEEELSAVIPTEAAGGTRVYLCAYTAGEAKSWLALDADRAPVRDRRVLRDAVSIAAMVELAEE